LETSYIAVNFGEWG